MKEELKPCPFCGGEAATRNEQAFCGGQPGCSGACWAWWIPNWNNAWCHKRIEELLGTVKLGIETLKKEIDHQRNMDYLISSDAVRALEEFERVIANSLREGEK